MIVAAALLVAAAAHWPGAAQADRQIRDQRAAFNRAIARGDLAGIGAVLADKALIVTGADSLVFSGKADEVVAKALDSTGGFHLVLAGAKFFLEHGIEPNLVVDHAPEAVASSWSAGR